uniref:ADP-ribosylation factor-like protein 6 n=1 Tax=Phallusia mammillata TaxID=59560 RepID=A0A6F9D6Z7_9ASCI|nr:ADP-ribosylation factor-like protein 6 [Phallusia mammillata]
MGLLDRLINWLQGKRKKAHILFVGLDNSGKSTIINQLKPKKERIPDIVPTVGIGEENFSLGSLDLTAFDMSGQGRYRNLWEHYYSNCDAIIFVLDSTDKLRISVAKEELMQLLRHKEIQRKRNLPVLFFANKSDLRESFSAVKCAQLLELDKGEWVKGGSPMYRGDPHSGLGRPWHICASNAHTGEGLNEGIQWITEQLLNSRNEK